MARSSFQKLKLLYIRDHLLRCSDEQHPVSVAQLILELERHGIAAERKSIYDDIEALRAYGMDILQTGGGKSSGYYVASRDFELPELKLLVDSVQSSKFITHKKTASLIKKIEGLASVHDAQLLNRQVYVKNRIKTMNESIYYNVDEIHRGIAENRKIRFHYFEYWSRIRLHINPELGHIPLNKLTQNDLQQFYGRLKKNGRKQFTELYGEGLSDRMVRMCHATCRSALEKAVQDGLIRTNPAIGCKLPPKKAREMKVLDRDELQRFLIQAQAEGYYEIFLLDLATGLRRGELLALQWDDLDFETGVLNINKQVYTVNGELQFSEPKTKNSIRKIVLPPSILEVLWEYKKTVFSRWMFPSPVKDDMPIAPGAVRRKLTGILERAGCKHVRFHDLRHTFATLAIQGGMDIKTLSAMLGHVSAATTLDIYTHITDDMQRQAAANIDRGIGKVSPPENGSAPGQETALGQSEKPCMTEFQPVLPSRRRAGTGCISQKGPNLWEGRYSPMWIDGKKRSRNVYARTREECEEKLKVLIIEMKTELAELKRQKAEKPKKKGK